MRHTVNDCPNDLPQKLIKTMNFDVLAKSPGRSIETLHSERNGFGAGFGGRIIIKA